MSGLRRICKLYGDMAVTGSKVQVTVKSVEAANRMLQERGLNIPKMTTSVVVKPATPSPNAIARAGERALQAAKRRAS